MLAGEELHGAEALCPTGGPHHKIKLGHSLQLTSAMSLRSQVKCLRVLQYFPLPEDPANSRMLNSTLKRIITGSEVAKNINKNNAQHAIVFEAIGLALALDADPDLLNAGAPCTTMPVSAAITRRAQLRQTPRRPQTPL